MDNTEKKLDNQNLNMEQKITTKSRKNLILKSGFKTAIKNLGQLVGLGFLITMAITLSLLSALTIERVQRSHINLLTNSARHDFIVDVSSNRMRISFNQDDWIGGENIDEFTNQDLFEQYLINQIARLGRHKEESEATTGEKLFTWSRTEARTFRNLVNDGNSLNVKAITKTGHIDDREENARVENIPVNRIVLADEKIDRNFSTDLNEAMREVIIQPNFARVNNIKRGDIIRLTPDGFGSELLVSKDVKDLRFGNDISINDPNLGISNSIYQNQNWFQVIGFGTSADFVYPLTNVSGALPSSRRDLIAYVAPQVFGLNLETIMIQGEDNKAMKMYSYELSSSRLSVSSENDREVYFSGRFTDPSYNENRNLHLREFDKAWVERGNINAHNLKMFYGIDDSDYRYFYRTATFDQVLWAYWVFATLMIALLLLISLFTIVLIVKKQVDETKTKLGTFKALGYNNWQLLQYFVATPIIISLIGFCLGYILVLALQNSFVNAFSNYFSIAFTGFNVIWWQAILVCLMTFIVMNLITITISYLVVEASALTLLNGNTIKKTSSLTRGIKLIFRKSNPNVKLHVSLLTASMGKITGTAAILLVSTTLISAVAIIPTTLEKNSRAVFAGLDYYDVVEYNEPVANNPSTFMRTFNPSNGQDWSFNSERFVTDISEASNLEQEYMTAYPLKFDRDRNQYIYDTNTIISNLLTNNIHSNYYSFNIPMNIENTFTSYYEIAKNNYTNWKVLSTQYLRKLDKIEIPSRDSEDVPYNALATITNQWTDYKFLINTIERLAVQENTNIGGLPKINSLRILASELQNFYKKYVNGLPNQIKNEFLTNSKDGLDIDALIQINFEDQLSETPTLDIYNSMGARTPIQLAAMGEQNLYYDNSENNLVNWTSVVNNFVNQDYDFDTNSLSYNGTDIGDLNFQDPSWGESDLLQLNTKLILWYWINYEGKIGTSLLQASYQSANNTVQQNMKYAIENGLDYKITNNVVPFNPETEEIGTMLNGTYLTSNQSLNLKIYGLNSDSVANTLLDSAGNNVLPNLFRPLNPDFRDYTPIVINQTVAHKLNLNVRDTMDISILKKLLVNKDNEAYSLDDVNMGFHSSFDFANQTSSGLVGEPRKNYLAYNAQNRGWTSQSQIQTATIGGHSLAATTIDTVGQSSEINQAANSGQIKSHEFGEKHNFVIVGIAENYGSSRAWISNDNANSILGYDEVKKYFFNNFFINEWKNSPALRSAYDAFEMYEISEAQWIDFIDYLNLTMLHWDNNDFKSNADNAYDDFINIFLRLDDNYPNTSGYKYSSRYLWRIFENSYPIFNYKYTRTHHFLDQEFTSSITQPFGDFSPIGLTGTSTIITDDAGISEIVFTEGHGESSLKQVRSLEDQRILLAKVDAILRIIVYMIAIIALIISTIIIVITTILIIQENSQFIATMKILGYTNRYVMTQVLAIYVFPFILTYVFGFLFGWFGIKRIVGFINSNYTFVIPYSFNIWLPFLVLGILASIYLVTILISYNQFIRIKPIDSLKIGS